VGLASADIGTQNGTADIAGARELFWTLSLWHTRKRVCRKAKEDS